jgi:hypothetical protein
MNFQGKIFFTQNWCNITLKSDGQKVYPHQQKNNHLSPQIMLLKEM